MLTTHPSLVIYSFAPKRLPSDEVLCEEAHAYLHRLWGACGGLGITDPIEDLNLPTSLPASIDPTNPSFRVVAAKMSLARLPGVHYQAFAFEYQDIFGVVVSLEAPAGGGGVAGWQALTREWMEHSPGSVPKGILGEVYAYGALYRDDAPPAPAQSAVALGVGEAVFGALPGSEGEPWRAATFDLTDAGFYIWEGVPAGERRVLAVVAPESKKGDLFGWLVWVGSTQLAPFARYLMHTSKVRFTQGVFERDIYFLRGQRQPIDRALDGLLELHGKVYAEEFTRPVTLSTVRAELNRMQDSSYSLLYHISRLKEMRVTTHIAEKNIKGLFAPSAHARALAVSGHSPFGQDLARVGWLREQIDMDLEYLQAVRERAEEGHKVMALRLELEAEKTARRLSDLVLMQGSLIGGLVVALTAAQAFQVRPALDKELYWPLIGLLAALAFALPPLVTHWHEGFRKTDLAAGGLLGAALTWFASLLWAAYLPALTFPVPNGLFLLYQVASLAAGFVLTYFLLRRADRAGAPSGGLPATPGREN